MTTLKCLRLKKSFKVFNCKLSINDIVNLTSKKLTLLKRGIYIEKTGWWLINRYLMTRYLMNRFHV